MEKEERQMNRHEKRIARFFLLLGVVLGIPLGFSLYPPIAQAEPSEWIGTHRLPLTEPIEVTSQNNPAKLIVQILTPHKKNIRIACNLNYTMHVWNEGEYGRGEITSFAFSSCSDSCPVQSITPWSSILQTTWLPPTGFIEELLNVNIEVSCYGTFSGTLNANIGDLDYTHSQDDIDHSLKLVGAKLTNSVNNDTLSITVRTLFYGPQNEEYITAERL